MPRGRTRPAHRRNITHNRYQPQRREQNPKETPISTLTAQVERLFDEKPDDIVVKILDGRFKYKVLLSLDWVDFDFVASLVNLLTLSAKCTLVSECLVDVFSLFVGSHFFNVHLFDHLDQPKHFGSASNFDHDYADYESFLANLIDLYAKCCEILDQEHSNNLTMLKIKLEAQLMQLNNVELLERFYEQSKLAELMQQLSESSQQGSDDDFKSKSPNSLILPDHIGFMNILPTRSDLIDNSKRPLRRNIVDGAYDDVDHYLDIQFRLLHEDFHRPLRHGFAKLKQILNDKSSRNNSSTTINHRLNEIDTLRVHLGVNIASVELSEWGLFYKINLNIENSSNKKKWQKSSSLSKRFMNGLFVCLSSDEFKRDWLIGVVANTETADLEQGVLFVKLERRSASSPIDFRSTYILIESRAYFEPYRHVLNALVKLSKAEDDLFPLKEQLVFVRYPQDNNVPDYLKNALINFK
jgi:hypothetical protein